MGSGPMRRLRAAGVTAVVLASLATVASPAAAQDGDVCFALTAEEIAAVVPGTFGEPVGSPPTCQWQGTTSGGQPAMVLLAYYPASLADLDAGTLQPTETTIAGYPAMTAVDTAADPPTGNAAVEIGDNVAALIVGTGNSTVDLVDTATQLATTAAGRLAAAPVDTEPDVDADTPDESTHPDPCSLFTAEELAAAMGATLSPFPDGNSCRWESADAGSSVSVAFDAAGLTAMESSFPGGERVTVAGQPAYQVDLGFSGLPSSQVSIDLGPDTISVLVSATDPSIDVVTVARDLTETAFGHGLQVLAEPEGVVATCQLATSEEIADAAGLSVKLALTDYETFCAYEGGKGNKHVMIQVASQDAATVASAMTALGATEVTGPGDQSWWMADYGSLTTLQGDLALQVTLMPDKKMPEAKLQKAAIAVMEALLAP